MKIARLLYDCGADWHYATGLHVSDPAPWCQTTDGQTHACISPLEYGLAQASPHKVDHIHALPFPPQPDPQLSPLLNTFSALLHCADWPDRIEVPAHFPAFLFKQMQDAGWPVIPVDEPFFATRPFKTPAEVAALKEAQSINGEGMAYARSLLAEAVIGDDDALFLEGTPLTSERLASEMNAFLLRRGCTAFAEGPIVAGGDQAATPHDRGSGQLYAHQFIIIDTFPRAANGYYGDMTRTYLKGTPSPWHEQVYTAVLDAQEAGLKALSAHTTGDAVHTAVRAVFERAGFSTGQTPEGVPYGFFHSTGHHVGLDLHDVGGRLLSPRGPQLKEGIVCSVEPGLYYPKGLHPEGFGGCRIEDVVCITADGHDNLTDTPKNDWVVA